MQHLLLQSEERFLPYIIMMCIFHIEKNAVVVDKRVRGERSQNRSFSRDEKRERAVVVVVVVVQTTEASQSCSKKEVVKVKSARSIENVIRINDNGIYLHRQFSNSIFERRRRRKNTTISGR